MILNPNPSGKKSSAILALLFCCPLWGAAFVCPSDTIIVDGKEVVVERRVSHTNETDPPLEETNRRALVRKYMLGFGAGGGVTLGSQSSGVAGFQTLDAFIGEPTGQRVMFDAGLTFGYESGEKWLVEAGIHLGYSAVGNRYFVGSALGDSLVAFESPEAGVLNQIQRYRYEIGEEWYTDPVALRKGGYSQLTMDIPVQVLTILPAPRGSRTLWMAGGGLRGRYLLSATSTNWVLLNESSDYQFIDLDDIVTRPFQLDLIITGGLRKVMNQKSHVGFRAFISMPVVGPVDTSSPLELRWVQAGLTVTVNKIFRHDQKRRTTN